jgi:hypothetical protein
VGFSDRLRSWLRGDAASKGKKAKRSTDTSSRASTKELEEFANSRAGVEAYLEPKTAIYSTTVLLIADDGEYLRRPVKDRDHANEFAAKINIPLYDARKVGYPKRMRDYDQGKRPRRVELSELPPWPGDGPLAADGPPPPPVRRPDDPPVEQAGDRIDDPNDPDTGRDDDPPPTPA